MFPPSFFTLYLARLNKDLKGVLIWDLEGEEFQQVFTYVGNPPLLQYLAPGKRKSSPLLTKTYPNLSLFYFVLSSLEMDVIADQLFAKFTSAGYKIGMTLRPSSFQAGDTLPSTCNYNTDPNLQDVFIKADASYPYRGYVCSASNQWSQAGSRLPNHQTQNNDDATMFQILQAKVAYAVNRWGASYFYVDSTV